MFGLDIAHSCNLLNVFLFGFLLLLYQKKLNNEKFNQTTFVLVLWLISAICGFFYVGGDKFHVGVGNMEFESVVIVFLLFLIYIWPILFIRNTKDVSVGFNWNIFIKISCFVVAFSAYLPVFENCYHLFGANTFSKMGNFHDEMDVKDSYAHLSYLGVFFSKILLDCTYITPALFINYMHKANKHRNRFVTFGLILALINHSLASFSVGARYVVVQDLSLYIFLYLMVRQSLSQELSKKLVKYFLVFFGILISGVVLITVARFGESGGEGVFESLYRYLGEGFSNCYSDMMYVKNHTYGLHIFRNIFGMTPDALTMITGIRMFVYYTFMGDFICDFDIVPTIVIFTIVSLLVYRGIIRKNKLGFLGIMCLTIYVSVIASGFMYVPFMNVFNALYYFIGYMVLYILFNKKTN